MRKIQGGKRENKKLLIIIGIILYRSLLDAAYISAIEPIFGYTGFNIGFDLFRYILSWLILGLVSALTFKLFNKILLSSIIIILLVLASFIPFTSMIALYPSYTINFIFINTIYWVLLLLFYRFIPNLKMAKLKNDGVSNLILNAIILVFFVVIFFISWRYTGFRVSIDLINVYDLRGEASNFQLPAFISYIYSASKAVNPILITYFLFRDKRISAMAIIFIQLLSFSINGSKTVFFTTVIAIVLFYLYRSKYLKAIPFLMAGIIILALAEIKFLDSFYLITLLIRRVFYVPNLLNYFYYDFFSTNTPDYLRQSFLRHFGFESPYIPIDNLIGGLYFNKPDMGANNGLLSDALVNFGLTGVIIMPLVIVIALKLLDASADGLDTKIIIISAITLTFIFISSLFFTILLTHGFIALCIVLYLLPRTGQNKVNQLKIYPE